MSGSDNLENDNTFTNTDSNPNQSMEVNLDRFAKLKIFLKNSLEEVSSGVSEEQYISLLGKLSALSKSKSAPGRMHKKMKSNLMESLTQEIEAMVEDEQMQVKLEKLDELVDVCAMDEGKTTWRPSGDVQEHMRSHNMAVKLKHKSALEEKVREREQTTEALRQQVGELRAQMHTLVKDLYHIQDQALHCDVIDRIDAKITEKVKTFA